MNMKQIYGIAIFDAIRYIEADRDNGRPVPKVAIAKEVGISTDYVEQILVPMRSAGLVRSVRGVHGGFHINREGVTALDIVQALGGIEKDGYKGDRSLITFMIDQCNEQLEEVLSKFTLS
jgi:Rrf2 family cysteine metabolism transcriptional repressor